jgi:hypothetical protein
MFLHVDYLSYIMSFAICHFQLKELEKMGPKKGVISQSVKDVVQSLVDDDLVLKDKIGTSVRFTICNCSIELILLVIQKRILMVLNSMHTKSLTMQLQLRVFSWLPITFSCCSYAFCIYFPN